MVKIREAIVVEGRYDKNTLSQVVDAPIIETRGFGIMKDKALLRYLRQVSEKRGLILLTDPDGAGFVIRNYLKGALPKDRIKEAYVPDISGKERRKRAPGKEGKLGVEGMDPETLLEALRRAGATFEEGSVPVCRQGEITMADFVRWGLSGGTGSSERRKALLKALDLPERMSSKGLLEAVNVIYGKEELEELILTLEKNHD